MIARELAWRVFAEELNSSSFQLEGKEREPSYLITPLGAKINRIFLVGVLTERELVSETTLRARVSDPTGVFTIYAGRYQEQALRVINSLSVPAFIAVIGKPRLYSPQEGVTYISVRPEQVKEVNSNIRDYWVLDTCSKLKAKLDLMKAALALEQPSQDKIIALGASKPLAEGIALALEKYKSIELEKYYRCLVDALHYLLPEHGEEKIVPAKPPKEEPGKNELRILELIQELDSGKGASWEKLLERAKAFKLDTNEVEEAVNALVDKGLVYEPILGILKKIE